MPLPCNKPSKKTRDILLRNLDCAVIQQIQDYLVEEGDVPPAFDSVRGVFLEGEPPYEGSAFYSKTHIQICVCNPNCIKGYFCPKERDARFRMP